MSIAETSGLFENPKHIGLDAQLARRAIRENWPIKPSTRKLIVDNMESIIGCSQSERNRIAASRVLVTADGVNVKREALDQMDDHHETGSTVNHNVSGAVAVGVGVRIIEDSNWYGNAHRLPAEAPIASGADPAIAVSVQAGGMRTEVRQDCDRVAGGNQGTR